MIIHAEALYKRYRRSLWDPGTVNALAGVSLSVAEGEIFGLLGPNGAGKTTFVKVILGAVFPDGGKATLFGKDVRDTGVKRLVGYLPEEFPCEGYLTGWTFLDCYGEMSVPDRALRKQRIEEAITALDLGRFMGTKISKYSKGMRKRLLIAHAVLNKPKLLILDEPAEGLDPFGQRLVRDLLRKSREEGSAVLLNSHILSELEWICDRVGILNEGRLVRVGTIRELTELRPLSAIRVEGATPEHLPPLPPGAAVDRCGNGVSITVSGQENVDAVVDILRRQEIHVSSIFPSRQTLEESFFRIVGGSTKEAPQ
jgi:ABC-2 type transport system ATP-binding protein